jgi:hypothetical protein
MPHQRFVAASSSKTAAGSSSSATTQDEAPHGSFIRGADQGRQIAQRASASMAPSNLGRFRRC